MIFQSMLLSQLFLLVDPKELFASVVFALSTVGRRVAILYKSYIIHGHKFTKYVAIFYDFSIIT